MSIVNDRWQTTGNIIKKYSEMHMKEHIHVILDQQNQTLIGIVSTRTRKIVNKAFLIDVLLVALHSLIGLVMLICALRGYVLVPSWIGLELKVFVYLAVPLLWLRLLFTVITHRLNLHQKKRSVCTFVLSVLALALALNLSVWYSNAAFPLMSITYVAQWILDCSLSAKSRRQGQAPLTSHAPSQKSIATKLKHTVAAAHNISTGIRHTKPSEHDVTAYLSQKVGIWHCPPDAKFADRLRIHLQPKVRQGVIDLWDASQIQPGTLWQDERALAVQSCAVAVILVSADLMACDSIICNELPQLLYRAMTKGTVILLLHISPCDFKSGGLEKFYPLNPPERPLAKMERTDREKVLSQAAYIICQRLGICL